MQAGPTFSSRPRNARASAATYTASVPTVHRITAPPTATSTNPDVGSVVTSSSAISIAAGVDDPCSARVPRLSWLDHQRSVFVRTPSRFANCSALSPLACHRDIACCHHARARRLVAMPASQDNSGHRATTWRARRLLPSRHFQYASVFGLTPSSAANSATVRSVFRSLRTRGSQTSLPLSRLPSLSRAQKSHADHISGRTDSLDGYQKLAATRAKLHPDELAAPLGSFTVHHPAGVTAWRPPHGFPRPERWGPRIVYDAGGIHVAGYNLAYDVIVAMTNTSTIPAEYLLEVSSFVSTSRRVQSPSRLESLGDSDSTAASWLQAA
jgi:hypothetical protein